MPQDDNMQQMILRLSRAFGLPNNDLDRTEGLDNLLDRIPEHMKRYLTVLYPQVPHHTDVSVTDIRSCWSLNTRGIYIRWGPRKRIGICDTLC